MRQQWVRSGRLKQALKLLAWLLYEQGKLNWDKGFMDATFASAKKWLCCRPDAARQGHHDRRGRSGDGLPLAVTSKALRLPSAWPSSSNRPPIRPHTASQSIRSKDERHHENRIKFIPRTATATQLRIERE